MPDSVVVEPLPSDALLPPELWSEDENDEEAADEEPFTLPEASSPPGRPKVRQRGRASGRASFLPVSDDACSV